MFNVMPHLSFQPEEIKTEKINCLVRTNEILSMVNLTVCFEMLETTKSKPGKDLSQKCDHLTAATTALPVNAFP